MLTGLGLDIVEVDMVAKALCRDPECALAWFTEREILNLAERASIPKVLAGRVAAKEAVAKSLRTGFAGDVTWQDVEIIAAPDGAPTVELSGGAKAAADSSGTVQILITISHTERTAAACAIAIGAAGVRPTHMPR